MMSAFLFLAVSAADASGFEEFFEEFAQKRDGIEVLRAEFHQTTMTPDEDIDLYGTIVYAEPKRILFRYLDPMLVYAMDGLRVYEYDSELRQVQIFDVEDRPETEAFFLGFDDEADRLVEAYDIQLMPEEADEEGGMALVLKPKDRPESEQYFERVTLQLRTKDFLPTEIHIVNDEESEVRIRVSDYVINEDLDPRDTQIFVPEGTVIIENDEFMGKVGAGGTYMPDEPAAGLASSQSPEPDAQLP